MAILDLKYYGDPILRKESSLIENIDSDLAQFAQDLIETMIVKKGIGLAANQVGHDIRIYAVDPSSVNADERPFVLINPKIIETEGEHGGEEGCLSFPGLFENIIHASSNTGEAEREIKLWFNPDELVYRIYPVSTIKKESEELIWI